VSARTSRWLVSTALLVGAAASLMASMWAGSHAVQPREIVLEARGMAFYLPGSETPNPTLRLAPGETVRLTLINRDAGVAHDLAVPSLGGALPLLRGADRAATTTLRAPAGRGSHDYRCTLHPAMMRGRILVGG